MNAPQPALAPASALLSAAFVLTPVLLRAQVSNPGPKLTVETAEHITAHCDEVYRKVFKEVKAKPEKVLPIVENYIVTNETCACEVVKAAIDATAADQDMRQQIAATAVHIAPNMSQVIFDCANLNPDALKAILSKESTSDNSADYATVPADIRGIYLIEPLASGISSNGSATTTTTKTVIKTVIKTTDGTPSTPTNPPNRPSPASPSTGGP